MNGILPPVLCFSFLLSEFGRQRDAANFLCSHFCCVSDNHSKEALLFKKCSHLVRKLGQSVLQREQRITLLASRAEAEERQVLRNTLVKIRLCFVLLLFFTSDVSFVWL